MKSKEAPGRRRPEKGTVHIMNPGLLSIIVDRGRYGFGEAGVPPSRALDTFAFAACNALLREPASTPLIEVMGAGFAFSADVDVTVAVTGAKILLQVGDRKVPGWSSFHLRRGEQARVIHVFEGLRYYVGFSGLIDVPRVMGSYTTNLECGFGGFYGRSLRKGDDLHLKALHAAGEGFVPLEWIPDMAEPHRLRFLRGPEEAAFMRASREKFYKGDEELCYTVSSASNRIGIRLDGPRLLFRKGAKESIISEGVLPGTVQVPAGGMPIILLHERTTGGYARIGVIAAADLDRLAHLKPKDRVLFERVSTEEAERLWTVRQKASRLINRLRRSS